jgi:transcriptional regulator with XRE-family HTH domain
MITPAQCRAARALIDWSQQQLAEAARIGNATLRNFEGAKSVPQNATLDVIRRALEAAGVVFVEENGGGPGVRLRKAPPATPDPSRAVRGATQALGMAHRAIDKAFESSTEPDHVKDKRRRALTERPPGAKW